MTTEYSKAPTWIRKMSTKSCSKESLCQYEAVDNDWDNMQKAPFETALHHAGNGRFQKLLLCACGAVYAACALSTTTLSFVLPSAACEFRFTSTDKGKLNATPLIGMCIGSYLWGNLADARGRKWAIIGALLLDAAAAFLSSVAQSFPLFLACRFFSGFGIIGATGLIFPYFGDFLTLRHRDVMLCRLEVFWTLGTILLPGIAWAVIPHVLQHAVISTQHFNYSSWRVFVAICGIPSLLVAALISPFPESPRYLLHAGRPDKAIAVLRNIYKVNTGQPADHYPISSMTCMDEDGTDEEEIMSSDANANETKPGSKWKAKLQSFWARKKVLFAPPNLGFLVLCCFVDFGLMFSYYTLMMWFPDLFERFEMYNKMHPNASAGVCKVSSVVIVDTENLTSDLTCDQSINSNVYLHTIIIGLSCIPTSLSVGIFINKVGKKLMLIMMLMTSGFAALGLSLVQSANQNLVLSCVFEAVISCTEAVLFCVICELFPTKVGATAMSLAVTCGRIGAIVGNVVFGALIDKDCYIPIYMFGGFLITSGLLCFVIPKSTRPERPPDLATLRAS